VSWSTRYECFVFVLCNTNQLVTSSAGDKVIRF